MRRLGRRSLFGEALAYLDEVALPAATPGDALRVELQVEGAEAARRSFRWQTAADLLDAAQQALATDAAAGATGAAAADPPDPARHHLFAVLAVGQGLLCLERGLPDQVPPFLTAARTAADHSGQAIDAVSVCFLELRLAYSLGRPETALDVLERFTARHGTTVRKGHLRQMQVRAALTVLQEPGPATASRSQAIGWLREVADADDMPRDERLLALSHLVLHWLGANEPGAAGADLARADQLMPAHADDGDLDERRLVLRSLRLRHALAIGDAGEARRRRDELADEWRELHARWADEPLRDSGLGPLFMTNRQRAFVELAAAELQLDGSAGPDAAFGRWLATEAHGSLARALGAAAASRADVQRLLGADGGGVLVFATGPEHGFVFAVDAAGVQVQPIPTSGWHIERLGSDLLRAIALARTASDRGERDRWRTAAARLRDVLLPAPIAARVAGWRAVAIVGADMVGYVPFELLPLADGRLLGADHVVSYLPSLLVGTWLAQHRPPPAPTPTARTLVLACPDAVPTEPVGAEIEPLAWTDADTALLVDAAARPEGVTVLTGGRATLAAAAPRLADVALLAIIAHGVRDERRPDPQGILLGDGRVARAADLERTPLPRYAVLAACRAGRGRLRRGDDGRHLLSGSALLGGARAVLVPWLDVDYAASKHLLATLEHGVACRGLTFGEAVRQARVTVGGEAAELSLEPFLFHLWGLPDGQLAPAQLEAPAVGARWPYGLAALALLLGGAAGWRARRRG